ncbi:MAG: sulfate adenylyltransferase [Planctomycetes bacterium]|nr:sulfate adenylyltransferase [Planctomycetota bacterium]
MSESKLVSPHGGQLVDRTGAKENASGVAAEITLTPHQQCDLEMIAIGAMSPLEGFMGEADYNSVCDNIALTSGAVWPIPVTCAVSAELAGKINVGDRVTFTDDQDRPLGTMKVTEKYKQDKAKQAAKAYGTQDAAHPGVKVLMEEGDTCIAGDIDVVTTRHDPMFVDHRLTPVQTRAKFAELGWKTVVAFQTRNPIHRAHEYLTKCAQEIVDGLLIHPLMGATKDGDISPEVRMACYETIIEKYYHPDHTMLAIMPAAMRYAGPREAILHAIYRQNYGCSHFIVGRDHAGVGNYYGTYDAQKIFENLPGDGLGIATLNFEHAAWSKKAGGMVSGKTFPKIDGDQIFLSGTKVREMLARGERPPAEFTRPEIADILIEEMKGKG